MDKQFSSTTPSSTMASSKNIEGGKEFEMKLQGLPVGIRFKPTDEHLAGYYLKKKVSGGADGPIFELIKEVDIYLHDPSNLKSIAYEFGDQHMYFFTTLDMEYRNRSNPHRLAPGGCWQKTPDTYYIKDENRKVYAARTLFVYYKIDQKSGKPVNTQWFMKEYMLVEKQTDEEFRMLAPLTLCVVYFLEDNKRKNWETGNECNDNKNNQNECDDIEKGSTQTLATDSSSGSIIPPTQNSNLDCQRNLVKSAEDPVYPGKRRCVCPHEIFSKAVSISSLENKDQQSSSNPSAKVERELAVNNIPFANLEQNMPNPVTSLATTESIVPIPNHNQILSLDPNMNIEQNMLNPVIGSTGTLIQMCRFQIIIRSRFLIQT